MSNPIPSREAILALLDRARRAAHRRGASPRRSACSPNTTSMPWASAWPRWCATASCCRTVAAAMRRRRSCDLIAGPRAGQCRGLRLPASGRRRRRPVSVAAADAHRAARRPRAGQRGRHRPSRPPPGRHRRSARAPLAAPGRARRDRERRDPGRAGRSPPAPEHHDPAGQGSRCPLRARSWSPRSPIRRRRIAARWARSSPCSANACSRRWSSRWRSPATTCRTNGPPQVIRQAEEVEPTGHRRRARGSRRICASCRW